MAASLVRRHIITVTMDDLRLALIVRPSLLFYFGLARP